MQYAKDDSQEIDWLLARDEIQPHEVKFNWTLDNPEISEYSTKLKHRKLKKLKF